MGEFYGCKVLGLSSTAGACKTERLFRPGRRAVLHGRYTRHVAVAVLSLTATGLRCGFTRTAGLLADCCSLSWSAGSLIASLRPCADSNSNCLQVPGYYACGFSLAEQPNNAHSTGRAFGGWWGCRLPAAGHSHSPGAVKSCAKARAGSREPGLPAPAPPWWRADIACCSCCNYRTR
jgi:hypothetical protein